MTTMNRRRLIGATILALAGLSPSGPAFASPRLVENASTPRRLRLRFSDRLVVRRTNAVITDHEGRRYRSRITFSADVRTMTVRPLEQLRPGVYHVKWTTVGQRGPATRGSFELTVR